MEALQHLCFYELLFVFKHAYYVLSDLSYGKPVICSLKLIGAYNVIILCQAINLLHPHCFM
jgi:hypothetical protein